MSKAEELKQEFIGKYWPIEIPTCIPDNTKGEQMESDLNELLRQYAQQEIERLAGFINERYQEGDDTFSIYDWIEQFKQQEGERKEILKDPPGYNDDAFKPRGNLKI